MNEKTILESEQDNHIQLVRRILAKGDQADHRDILDNKESLTCSADLNLVDQSGETSYSTGIRHGSKDITNIGVNGEFMYLAVVIDWHCKAILSQKLLSHLLVL